VAFILIAISFYAWLIWFVVSNVRKEYKQFE